jgi:hypothetical protein
MDAEVHGREGWSGVVVVSAKNNHRRPTVQHSSKVVIVLQYDEASFP